MHCFMKYYPASLLLVALLLPAPPALPQVKPQQTIPGVPPERMWLAPSREYLRQHLEMAVLQALADSNCVEVMYARLNEYRTRESEPTFTVLCRKDHRSTFNLIYQISSLDPEFRAPDRSYQGDEPGDIKAAEPELQNLAELRDLLAKEELLLPQQSDTSTAPGMVLTPPAPPRRAEDALELDEMMKAAPSPDQVAPDLF